MTQTQRLVVAVYVLAAAVVAAAVVYVVGNLGPDPCSPEMRKQALSSDVSAALAGQISFNESVRREQARIEACD